MSTLNMTFQRFISIGSRSPKQVLIGGILVTALIAFELFNFDTTQYALENLLGPVAFVGIGWATILAIAFCGIDLAGLVRLFTPQQGGDEPKEVWYLMGAWLLGATMNAVMTWWAVSLTLLNHDFGNEVLSREQLLRYVPIFVAVLVWLTRILFIGSLSVAGEHFLGQRDYEHEPARSRPTAPPKRAGKPSPRPAAAAPVSRSQPAPMQTAGRNETAAPAQLASTPAASGSSGSVAKQSLRTPATSGSDGRVRQRPPRPGMRPSSINASGRPK